MKKNLRSLLIPLAAAVVVLGALLCLLFRQTPSKPPAGLARQTASQPAAPVQSESTSAEHGAPPLPQPDEVAATISMYAAHAPLRVPEVSNPDSAANLQILQTMVRKALDKQRAEESHEAREAQDARDAREAQARQEEREARP
jgi:hypothetical protein